MVHFYNIKATLSYDGSAFHGFQSQAGSNLRTVQESLEQTWTKMYKEKISVVGSGRTDAGVHAEGQVVNFHTELRIPEERLAKALTSRLPRDIVISSAEYVPADFHARFSAVGKHYIYRVLNRPLPTAIGRNLVYHCPYKLDLTALKTAAEYFLGEHDFRGFASADTKVACTVRTVSGCELKERGALLEFHISGNGFLYNMVRIMVGTLLDIGRGKLPPETVPAVLENGDRTTAGFTAPAHGLYLYKVFYS